MSEGVEEDRGVLKSASIIGGFIPLKGKKNVYAVLSERALEIHESEKSRKKKKCAKYLLDLSICFNCHLHMDSKLKQCVALMGPEETFLLRGVSDEETLDWRDALISALIPARATRFGRPVLPAELFECAWDVVLVSTPKLRKPVPVSSGDQMPCLSAKQPALTGPFRLCFYPHTIVLCKRGIESASGSDLPRSGFPPFRPVDFFEFQRQFISNFGHQEKYFLLRIGRSAPTGSGELWMQCESEETAGDVHNKLNAIIARESEKKRLLNNSLILSASSSTQTSSSSFTPSTHHHHRDRAHTQPQRVFDQHLHDNNEVQRTLPISAREKRAMLRDCKALVDSFDEETELRNVRKSSLSTFETGIRNSSSTSMTVRKASTGTPIIPAIPLLWSAPLRANINLTPSCASLTSRRRQSEVITEEFISTSSIDPQFSLSTSNVDDDSGGTLRFDQLSLSSRQEPLPLPDMDYSDDIVRTIPLASDMDYSDGIVQNKKIDLVDKSGECYTPMDIPSWSSDSATHLAVPGGERWHLEEIHSYVSDSSDSCYSSMAAPSNTTRAWSFGSRPGNIPPAIASSSSNHPTGESSPRLDDSISSCTSFVNQSTIENQLAIPDDPRKRAYSLGSKSWLPKSFRKVSRGGILSLQPRSGSFGSSKNRRTARHQDHHLMEMHFATSPVPSITSSPSRSRTSSFETSRGHSETGKGNEKEKPSARLVADCRDMSRLIADCRDSSRLIADFRDSSRLVADCRTVPVDQEDYVLADPVVVIDEGYALLVQVEESHNPIPTTTMTMTMATIPSPRRSIEESHNPNPIPTMTMATTKMPSPRRPMEETVEYSQVLSRPSS